MINKPILEINLLQYSKSFQNFLEQSQSLISGLSIINKSPFDQPVEVIEEIATNFAQLRIIPHLSIKQNYNTSSKKTFEILQNKLTKYQETGIKEVFVISGMPKRSLDSVAFLQLLPSYPDLSVAIAYNPFLKDQNSQALENQRLETKLSFSCVKTVYLQLGQDLAVYQKAINYIYTLRPDIEIIVAVLNPMAIRVISSFNLRPWNGVFYSTQYLTSLDYRLNFTKELVTYIQSTPAKILLEFFTKTEDIKHILVD